MPDFKTTSEGLEEVSRLGLAFFAPVEAIITDVNHLASYNWIEASTLTHCCPEQSSLVVQLSGPLH